MTEYIDKAALVTEIKRIINEINLDTIEDWRYRLQREHDIEVMKNILSFIDTLEVIDPYEQCIQYPTVKDGIEAHAETYSFNIESELFNQLTKEQQTLWRKEIEQAVISGGYNGIELARDLRYKENLEVKEVDLEKEIKLWFDYGLPNNEELLDYIKETAEHFFELGLKAQKGEL